MDNNKVELFGVPGLIHDLRRNGRWEDAIPNGQDFSGFCVGQFCLTVPADGFSPEPCALTIESDGDRFDVFGFIGRKAFLIAEANDFKGADGAVEICGKKLSAKSKGKKNTKYTIYCR